MKISPLIFNNLYTYNKPLSFKGFDDDDEDDDEDDANYNDIVIYEKPTLGDIKEIKKHIDIYGDVTGNIENNSGNIFISSTNILGNLKNISGNISMPYGGFVSGNIENNKGLISIIESSVDGDIINHQGRVILAGVEMGSLKAPINKISLDKVNLVNLELLPASYTAEENIAEYNKANIKYSNVHDLGANSNLKVNGFDIISVTDSKEGIKFTSITTPQGFVYVNGKKVHGKTVLETYRDYMDVYSKAPIISGPGWHKRLCIYDESNTFRLPSTCNVYGNVIFKNGPGLLLLEHGALVEGNVINGTIKHVPSEEFKWE